MAILSVVTGALLLLSRFATANPATCGRLDKAFPDQVHFPESNDYINETQSYWSADAWLLPDCVLSPANTKDFARAVKILAQHNTTFAVRGGGHAPVRGIANTNDGVLLTTRHFHEATIVPTPNRFKVPYVSVGTGLRWGQLFEYLEENNLMSMGGRYFSVGIGTVLGGGISFFGQSEGWASNTVVNFELITAAGDILQVNRGSHPDLFWALKGGGNNFGIVTRIDIRTFPRHDIYALNVQYPENQTQLYIDAMTAWTRPGGGNIDDLGHVNPATTYQPVTKTVNTLMIGFRNAPEDRPWHLENFTSIPSQPLGVSGVQSMYTLVNTSRNSYPEGEFSWRWYSTCLKFSEETMNIILDTMREVADEKLPHLDGLLGATPEPITEGFLRNARRNGGDPMDLNPADGGFMIAEYWVAWGPGTTAVEVEDYLQTLVQRVEAITKPKGLYYPFKFFNNLGMEQDPFALYGNGRSLPKLKKVSAKYDPRGVFQRLVPGFKLTQFLDGA